MLIFIFFLVFCSIGMLCMFTAPSIYDRMAIASEKRKKELSMSMEAMMDVQKAERISKMLAFSPIIFGVSAYFLFAEEVRIPAIIMAISIGIIFPYMYVKHLDKQIRKKFANQLIDALMIMSSSFRGGLSLVQAMEAVAEEMPSPINKEFGIVLGENKMGVALEDALSHLHQRMPSNSLQQMITAILLSRETGGNLPAVFSRIVVNIREKKKVQNDLATLTLQGRIQGVVMALLPIAFGFLLFTSNRALFDNMLRSDLGRGMLIYALFSEIIGALLIIKISTFKEI